mgnify:CR=1 FL=1
MNDNEKKQFIIENQDLLFYKYLKGNNKIDVFENLKDELENYIINDPEMIKRITSNNLTILGFHKRTKAIDEELIKRFNSGENIFGELRLEPDFYVGVDIQEYQFINIVNKVDVAKVLRPKAQDLKVKDMKAYNFIRNARKNITLSNFFEAYDQGEINDNKIDLLEKLIGNNLNIIDSTNYRLCKDEIFSMNENFIKKMMRYKNGSAQLLLINKHNPKLFNELKKNINNWEETLNPRAASDLEYTILKNCGLYLYEMKDYKDGDFNNVMDFCIRQGRQIENSSNSVMYSENYEKEYEEMCDKLFKSDDMNKKLSAYCNKFLGMGSVYYYRKVYERKLKNLDFDKIKNAEFKEYVNRVKEAMELDVKSEDFLEKIELLYNSKNKRYTPRESFYAEELANFEILKSYEKKFEKTINNIENSENFQNINYNGQNIKQVTMSGDYSLIIRSTDTSFVAEKKLDDNSVRKTEEQNADPAIMMKSGTYVTQDFTGVAPLGNEGAYFVYLKNNARNMGEIGNSDINSHIRDFGVYSGNGQSFDADKIEENCRKVYAEATVFDRNPDAIALFSDSNDRQKENAYKAASEYGINVLYFDKDRMVDEQIGRLNNLIKEFEETNDVNLMQQLVSQYETNVAGWLLNRDNTKKDESVTACINNEKYSGKFQSVENRIYKLISKYCNEQSKKDNRKRKYRTCC